MNIDNWVPYLKLDDRGEYRCMSQQTYEPLINPEGNIFCANYDWQNKYQRQGGQRLAYTEDVVDFFWNKELANVLKFQNSVYAPEIIDIEYTKKRLFFKWNNISCNEIIYGRQNLKDYCPDWQQQLLDIFVDLHARGTYKLTMYSHCHFIDSNGIMKTFDWYGCMPINDHIIKAKFMEAIVHGTAVHRIDEVKTSTGDYNLEAMFKRSMAKYVKWGENDLIYIYRKLFNEDPDHG